MNLKINVGHPEISRLVQEHAFKMGISWAGDEKFVQLTHAKYLYIQNDFISQGSKLDYFKTKDLEELTPSEFLNLPLEKEVKFGCEKIKVENGAILLDNKGVTIKRLEELISVYENGYLKVDVLGYRLKIQQGAVWAGGTPIRREDVHNLIEAIRDDN